VQCYGAGILALEGDALNWHSVCSWCTVSKQYCTSGM